jgi:glycosidase
MPDLNYREDAVTAAMRDAARFWLVDLGVDGFRLDAVKHLIEDGETQVHTDETHTWLATFDDFTDDFLVGEPDLAVMTVGELWDSTRLVAPYVTGGEVDLAFEFDLAGAIVAAVQSGDPAWFGYVLEQVEGAYPDHAYAPFLTNHDQNRVMSQLRGDVSRAKLAASILLTLPGVPFVYYGEEIGMTGVKPDEQIRTPMQWNAEPHAGFSTGEPWIAVSEDYPTVNVAAQSDDPDSLLSHYRRLIHLRTAEPALRHGTWVPVAAACKGTYGFLRHLSGAAPVLVLFNFDDVAQEGCAFSLASGPWVSGETAAREALTGVELPGPTVDGAGGFSDYSPKATLAPGESLILVVD